MDAFYASVEQRDDPSLRGRPLAVGGRPESRGVVAAASYEARAFGVRSAMPMARALRLCPNLAIVRPDFPRYRAASQHILEIFRSCTPLVEPLSLDEAYLDVSDNLWGEALATPVAMRLKQRIREETGLTASAGVAPNKFLAKIASGWQKPDGLTVISPGRVEAFLQQLPVDALWGVGPVTAGKLRKIGIVRLVDVRAADPVLLQRAIGSLADVLRRLALGDDPRPVVPDRPYKSSSSENTYDEDLLDLDTIRTEIERMASQAAQWLERKELLARTVNIKVRYADFTTVTRSHTPRCPRATRATKSPRAPSRCGKTDAGDAALPRLLGRGRSQLHRCPRGHVRPKLHALPFE